MNAQDLTAALVDVYARLRRGVLTDAAARREASGYYSTLRELAADAKAQDRESSKKADVRTIIEMVYIPGDYGNADLERLTPDFKPWNEQEKTAQEGRLTPEDVELLEVNTLARARRGEITESSARAEAYILKAIRLGLVLAPVAGGVTWGDYKKAVADEDARRGDAITVFSHVPDEKEFVSGPMIKFIHGIPRPGQTPEADSPPWPLFEGGRVRGYFVPKGWAKPEGDEFNAMVERVRAAHPYAAWA